jgi:hypothetical protein
MGRITFALLGKGAFSKFAYQGTIWPFAGSQLFPAILSLAVFVNEGALCRPIWVYNNRNEVIRVSATNSSGCYLPIHTCY